MIGRRGKRGSGISVLAARHDDDDDDDIYQVAGKQFYIYITFVYLKTQVQPVFEIYK